MYFLLLFLFMVAAVIIAVFFEPVAISFSLDTNKMDMHAVAKWVPFISVEASTVEYRMFITVYFFKKKIYAKFLKSGKNGKSVKGLFESLDLSNTSAKIAYGFNEPYLTGIFCGAADFIVTLISSVDIELEPEFIPENEFLIVKAQTELNAGKTLINMLRTKFANVKRRKKYGSTEFNQ